MFVSWGYQCVYRCTPICACKWFIEISTRSTSVRRLIKLGPFPPSDSMDSARSHHSADKRRIIASARSIVRDSTAWTNRVHRYSKTDQFLFFCFSRNTPWCFEKSSNWFGANCLLYVRKKIIVLSSKRCSPGQLTRRNAVETVSRNRRRGPRKKSNFLYQPISCNFSIDWRHTQSHV